MSTRLGLAGTPTTKPPIGAKTPVSGGYNLYIQEAEITAGSTAHTKVNIVTTAALLATGLAPNTTYRVGLRARTAHDHLSPNATPSAFIRTDGSGNPQFLPGSPSRLSAASEASGNVLVTWEYVDQFTADPDEFSVRSDGAEQTTVSFSAGQAKYTATIGPLAVGERIITVASRIIATGNVVESAGVRVVAVTAAPTGPLTAAAAQV